MSLGGIVVLWGFPGHWLLDLLKLMLCCHRLGRRVLSLLMVGLFPGSVAAFQSDIHFDATFAIALATGWSWEEATLVAGANQSVDENLETRPAAQFADEKSIYDRTSGGDFQLEMQQGKQALGRGMDWVARHSPYPPSLPLQDYLFHCFSKQRDTRGQRNADAMERLVALEGDAFAAIDKARTQPSKANQTRALIAIGVYLHCQQDSWSHSGYGGESMGHVKDGTLPDNPSMDPQLTTSALLETVAELRQYRKRWGLDKSMELAPKAWTELLAVLTNGMALKLDDSDRRACNKDLIGYWLYGTLVELNRLNDRHTISEPRRQLLNRNLEGRIVASSGSIGNVNPETGLPERRLELTDQRRRHPELLTPSRPGITVRVFLASRECDAVLENAFAAVPDIAERKNKPWCAFSNQPCPPLPFRQVVFHNREYPQLKLKALIIDPVEDSAGTFRRLAPE